MQFTNAARAAPRNAVSGPRGLEKLAGFYCKSTASIVEIQAVFKIRRFGVAPAIVHVVAGAAFGKVRQ
jgi:hypothetical protein